MTTKLIVTVDTEEEGLWGGKWRPAGNTVENVRGVDRFQRLCDRFGVFPTYLVDAPVVEEDWAVDMLRAYQDQGRAEIGGHLHPWCTPPLEKEITARNTYMCNLPETVQRHKLIWLTDRIEERFGRRPTSFRAGRYGLDTVGVKILQELSYQVDSSVIPFTDYSAGGGPNFEDAPYAPYWVDGEDLCTVAESSSLLEVPVSVGFNRPDFARAQAIRQIAMRPWLRRFHSVGILDRLGIVRRIKFSPEQANSARMRQLADAYVLGGSPALVMMFHSTSLAPGFSPYVRTEHDVDRFHQTLEATFDYCLGQHRMEPETLTGFAAIIRPTSAPVGNRTLTTPPTR